jgi:hypothetical protein
VTHLSGENAGSRVARGSSLIARSSQLFAR